MSEATETDSREILANEDLLRCVPPGHIDESHSLGTLHPHVFWPARAEDKGELSVDREALRTPAECFKYRVEVLKLATVGVLSVTTDEVSEIELNALADPLADNDAHAVIDFRPRLQEKRIREVLLKRATARGWRFTP